MSCVKQARIYTLQFGPFVTRRIFAEKQREYVLVVVEEILMLTQVVGSSGFHGATKQSTAGS